jgi:hypothetical protein
MVTEHFAHGTRFAPASAAGSVMIGTMPLFVAVFSAVFDGERFSFVRKLGFAAVVFGVVLIALRGQEGVWRGYPFFLCAALLWAGYTMAFRRAGIGSWHAAGLINVYSLVVFAPVYLLVMDTHLMTASTADIALQAVMQGRLRCRRTILLRAGDSPTWCVSSGRDHVVDPGRRSISWFADSGRDARHRRVDWHRPRERGRGVRKRRAFQITLRMNDPIVGLRGRQFSSRFARNRDTAMSVKALTFAGACRPSGKTT